MPKTGSHFTNQQPAIDLPAGAIRAPAPPLRSSRASGHRHLSPIRPRLPRVRGRASAAARTSLLPFSLCALSSGAPAPRAPLGISRAAKGGEAPLDEQVLREEDCRQADARSAGRSAATRKEDGPAGPRAAIVRPAVARTLALARSAQESSDTAGRQDAACMHSPGCPHGDRPRCGHRELPERQHRGDHQPRSPHASCLPGRVRGKKRSLEAGRQAPNRPAQARRTTERPQQQWLHHHRHPLPRESDPAKVEVFEVDQGGAKTAIRQRGAGCDAVPPTRTSPGLFHRYAGADGE